MRLAWKLGWGVLLTVCQPACAVATIEGDAFEDSMSDESVDEGVGAQGSGGDADSGSGSNDGAGGSPPSMSSGGSPGPSGAGGSPASGGRSSSGGRSGSGGRPGIGSGVGGAGSGSACTDVLPPPSETDWPAGTCQGWATSTTECDEDWMVNGDDGKGWCNRSCGRCSGF